ncbi:MAG: NAD(+) synthase [Flammeovirgaceae bacterium]|nr:NAD(+) synthase [Flammeovirgaceae bacterium]
MNSEEIQNSLPNRQAGKFKIGGATLNQTPIDWNNNTTNILQAIEIAKAEKVDILCLPELTITSYGCEDLFLSDWLSQKAFEELQKIQPYCTHITVCVGLPIRFNNITYNGAAVIHHTRLLGITLKQNLARDGIHYEPRWFNPWEPGKVTTLTINQTTFEVGDLIYEVNGIKFGFEICEDAWRSNRSGISLCDRGANLILNPSASHFAIGKSLDREKIVVDGSRQLNCAYVYVNLLGNESGRIIYDGDIIIAQHGKLLAVNERLCFKRVDLLACEINFLNPSASQSIPLSDGKEENEELARAASLALFDYLRKSKAKGYVLSLSGGADSALCAVLVSEMVKRATMEMGHRQFCNSFGINFTDDWREIVGQLLTCAYQGTKNSSTLTFQAAKQLAESIGALFHHWLLDEEIVSYTQKVEKALDQKLSWATDDITLQNIQARSRSPVIWMLANIKHAILLTTSNRSEGAVGYATMDGDTSGSLAPIAGLSKTFILQWLKWAEKNLGHDGLHAVNNLQPTAELRPSDRNQTDESDLMPYAVLNEIERLAIQERKSPKEVYAAMSSGIYAQEQIKTWIKKFFKLWSANQWKRERLAPSFHLDDLNVDPRSWCRFPILSGSFEDELSQL